MSVTKDTYIFDAATMEGVAALEEMGRGAMQRKIERLTTLLIQVETVLGMEAHAHDRAKEAKRLIAQARKLGLL